MAPGIGMFDAKSKREIGSSTIHTKGVPGGDESPPWYTQMQQEPLILCLLLIISTNVSEDKFC
jgi:hypothetical protein